MTPSLCALFADYNRTLNLRLYAAASKLSAEELTRERGAFFGSLFNTMNHIAVADLLWLHRFATLPGLSAIQVELSALPRPTSLREPLAESLEGLAALRTSTDAVIVRLASLLTEELLGSTLRYTNTAGQSNARNFGLLLHHFFNHETHHRGQASTLLFQAGIDIGVTDFIAHIPSEA
jgi:uncharacterized damage-inducible protein DinB